MKMDSNTMRCLFGLFCVAIRWNVAFVTSQGLFKSSSSGVEGATLLHDTCYNSTAHILPSTFHLFHMRLFQFICSVETYIGSRMLASNMSQIAYAQVLVSGGFGLIWLDLIQLYLIWFDSFFSRRLVASSGRYVAFACDLFSTSSDSCFLICGCLIRWMCHTQRRRAWSSSAAHRTRRSETAPLRLLSSVSTSSFRLSSFIVHRYRDPGGIYPPSSSFCHPFLHVLFATYRRQFIMTGRPPPYGY